MGYIENQEAFLSVIVPAFNEESVIDRFVERTVSVLERINPKFEIIFINDGSTDSTKHKIKNAHERDSRIKMIGFSRNFGKEAAMTAGLDYAEGELVVVIDADLQHPPELIEQMVQKAKEGYDTVYAARLEREGESFLKKTTARTFYAVIGRLSKVEVPSNTGDFRLMNRKTVDALKLLRERRRFMKGLFSWVGFRQTSIPYHTDARAGGKTKWNYWRLWNFALEGITSFSHVPLQAAVYLGLLIAMGAFLFAAFLVFRTLVFGRDVPGYASIMTAISFFSGVQLIFLGVIGEYLGRMFDEIKGRPLYLVEEKIGVSLKANYTQKDTSVVTEAPNSQKY